MGSSPDPLSTPARQQRTQCRAAGALAALVHANQPAHAAPADLSALGATVAAALRASANGGVRRLGEGTPALPGRAELASPHPAASRRRRERRRSVSVTFSFEGTGFKIAFSVTFSFDLTRSLLFLLRA